MRKESTKRRQRQEQPCDRDLLPAELKERCSGRHLPALFPPTNWRGMSIVFSKVRSPVNFLCRSQLRERKFRRRAFCHSTVVQAAAESQAIQFSRAGISAAGRALLNRYPCPSLHPLAFRYANCSVFSTPSAVVVKPNAFARPRIARTIN